MLGKVIKQELRSTWKNFAVVGAVLLALGIVTKITGVFDAFIGVQYYTETELIMLAGIGIALIGLASWVFIAAMVLIIRRYHAGMYGEECYLTHTLPVTGWELLLGKFLSSCLWLLASAAISALALFISAWGIDWAAFFDGIADMLGKYYTIGLGSLAGSFLLQYAVEIFADILMIFLAVSFACQTFTKGRFLVGLGAYILQNILLQKTRELFAALLRINMDIADFTLTSAQLYSAAALSVVVSLAFGVAAFFLTDYLVSKRLNLE